MTVGPSTSGLSFSLARAYGVPGGPASVRPVAPAAPAPPVGRIAPASDSPPRPERPDGLDRLVAAVVPGRVNFDGPAAAPGPGEPLPFYRHPGDRNEAATAIRLGRGLDVEA